MLDPDDEIPDSPSGAAQPVDLWNICDAALESVADAARSKAVDCGCWVRPEEASAFQGDPEQLRDGLTHLLAVAIAYSEPGGEIFLHVSMESEDDEAAWLHFAVSANRIELPLETGRQADPAWRHWTATEKLVGEIHGETGFESVPEIGSTFWFSVRLTRRAAAPENTPSLPFQALVLGANPLARRILVNQLRFLGLHSVQATESAEAVRLFDAKQPCDPFELVFIDLSLPLRNTVEAARPLIAKARDAGKSLVLLATGDANPPALELPGTAICLAKPVTQNRLAGIVHGHGGAAALPAVPVQTARPAAAPAEPPPLPSRRVLVVEDDDIARKVALALLKKLGFEADAAADGPQALETATARHYGVILMDCQLPGMDGYEATRKIREHEAASPGRPAAILAMSNDPQQKNRQKCLDAGMDDCLGKPLRREELGTALTRWLSADSPRKAAPGATPSPAQPPLPLPPGETLVDMRRLWECADDDRQELRLLLETYFYDTGIHLSRMDELIRAGDAEGLARLAHRLGGGSATLGLSGVLDPLRQLEEIGTGRSVEGAAVHLARARERLAAIRKFLETQPETALWKPTPPKTP